MSRSKRVPLSAAVVDDMHYAVDRQKEREREGLPELDRLALEIKDEHAAATQAFESGFEHGIRAGQLLIEAKAQVMHGEWSKWLADNTDVSVRASQMYMRIAREAAGLPEAKRKQLAQRGLKGALADLSEPRSKTKPVSHLPESSGSDTSPTGPKTKPVSHLDNDSSQEAPETTPDSELEARLQADINAFEGKLTQAAVRRVLERLIGRLV